MLRIRCLPPARFSAWRPLLLALAGVAACFGSAMPARADDPAPAVADAERQVYRVGRGDDLSFRFTYTPELNTQAVVRPDGRVALPLIGELFIEGLTVAELTELVQARLEGQVRRPQLVINVQGGGSQRVFIGGEVGRPGVQPLVGPLTVLQAVMAAEGLKDSAQPSEVLLLRRGPKGEAQAQRVDLAGLMAGQPGARDVELRAFDVVVVPKSGIASLGLWVDQYIRRVLPMSLGFSYVINRNNAIQ